MTANPFFAFAQRRREREEEFGYDNPEDATKKMEEGLDTNSNRQQRYESQRWGFSQGQPVFILEQ